MWMRVRRGVIAVALLLEAVVLVTAPSAASAATATLTRSYSVSGGALGRYQADVYGSRHGPFSSPAIGDVTGDGVLDEVHANANGFLYIYRADTGALQRKIEVGVGNAVSSPTLTDLNDDGRLDILVGLMPSDEGSAPRTIGGYDGSTGALLFSKKTCTYPGKPCNVFSTIAVGDVDGDLDEDIVATSQDHYLHVWRDDGTYLPGFPIYLRDTTWSSPAIADLDNDGTAEIVMVVDLDKGNCSNDAGLGCSAGQFGSMIWVVESNGAISARRVIQGEVAFSSPAVGDIDGDGFPDIVVGSGNVFRWSGTSGEAERRVSAFNRNLTSLPGWPVTMRNATMASPALVDVDNNGTYEVAVSDSEGWLRVYHPNGVLRWEVCGRDSTSACRDGAYGTTPDTGIYSSPVAADVDNDGDNEIVFNGERRLRVYDGRTGAVEWSHFMYGDPNKLLNQISTPAVFEMDGQARIAYHVLWNFGGGGRDAEDQDGLFLFTSNTALGDSDWPAFRGDPRTRQGSVDPLPVIDVPNTSDGRFVAKAFADLLNRPVDKASQRYWYGYVRAHGRAAFTRGLVFASSCEWSRKVVRDIYLQVLGREPEKAGLDYWTARVCGGMKARDFAASIYGSSEYFNSPDQGGGTAGGYVDELYSDILNRKPDSARSFWIAEVGRRGTASVAKDFYQSDESRRRRVTDQYTYLLGRRPDAQGRAYWAGLLRTADDLELTVFLTSSTEYYTTPCTRC